MFRLFCDLVTETGHRFGYTKVKPRKGAENMAAVHMNRELFENLKKKNTPVLVDYWAPWCGYCRRIEPVYDKIAEQYDNSLIVAKINIDEEPQLARDEQIEVIPTLVLYQNGEELGSIVAPDSKPKIEQFIQESLKQ